MPTAWTSIGPGGIEISSLALRCWQLRHTSIGPGGIEIQMNGPHVGGEEELQSDLVELKLNLMALIDGGNPYFNRTWWN